MSDRPRLEACYFDGEGAKVDFRRLAEVLRLSALRHCPAWDVNVRLVIPDPRAVRPNDAASLAHNTQKMDEWARIVGRSGDGDRVLLIDADTMIVGPLDDAWSQDFDLAYTGGRARFPFNSGVVFLRVTPAARAFVAAWQVENDRLYRAPHEHERWRRIYGGINQAALGAMLTNGIVERLGLRVTMLPCLHWNSCETGHWQRYNPKTARIIHIKSDLRNEMFRRAQQRPDLKPLVSRWKAYDAEARGVPVPVAPKVTVGPRGMVPLRRSAV